jgi:RNA polymerase sigma factor (sigma-70 family)
MNPASSADGPEPTNPLAGEPSREAAPRDGAPLEGDFDAISSPTSLHVGRARQGDSESLSWVIERFSPLLLASARYRLRGELLRVCDPEDLVQEVWMVAIGRLGDLRPRDGRYTPVLLKFLTTTLLGKLSNLFQKHVRGKPKRLEPRDDRDADRGAAGIEQVASPWTGVITRVLRREVEDAVASSLASLAPADLEIVLLRGIEQHSYKEIAAIIGGEPKSLVVRYGRALEKLRQRLPESVFAELIDE